MSNETQRKQSPFSTERIQLPLIERKRIFVTLLEWIQSNGSVLQVVGMLGNNGDLGIDVNL